MADSSALPADEDAWEVGAGVIRPYLFTRGRTRPAERTLAVETMLVARGAYGWSTVRDLALEQRKILELCQAPRSVAEVAAKLSIPLGVVRVVLADLIEAQLLEVRSPRTDRDLAADVELLQRLIARVKAIAN
jgi:hypothetical protein